jgi:hypothetical protein
MKYLDFVNDKKILTVIVGSSEEDVRKLEGELGYNIPLALKEYLLLMGETSIYTEYDYHGTRDMKYIRDWIYEWIERYRNEGIPLNELKEILPFDKFQDTFFYVPIEEGSDNPAVYAFDINESPTIRRIKEI